ncbi:hypothetical protein [Vibrio phage vB_ValP_IME234]|nr:hypothetical protein [Vibrio phage vB_ValP_IME234]
MLRCKEWDEINNSAKEFVEGVWKQCLDPSLRETSSHMQEDYDEFYEVVKAVLSCDQNPYGFLDDGGWLNTWTSTESFIHSLHHSCIDDGEHCYLSCPTHGPKLVFRCKYDYTAQELYYILFPMTKDLDERMEEVYNKHGKERKPKEYEFHNDYKRFIKELNDRPAFEEQRNKEFEERMLKLKGKMS